MTTKQLAWDRVGERLYETGVSKGVLYTPYDKGFAWNGLVSIDEAPSGAEPNKQWADDINYLTLLSAETYACTLEAFTYPDAFAACIGEVELAVGVGITQQNRDSFGLCYRTNVGNDIKREQYGYKLHLVYGCTAQPAGKTYETMNDSPEAITMSWEIATTPVEVVNHRPTAKIVIDSTKVPANKMKAIEDILYGTEAVDPRLPLPSEIATIMNAEG